MAFFVPFLLGAVAATTGIRVYNHCKKKYFCEKGECSCGCGDKCECGPDCDCGCHSSLKKKVVGKVDVALEKIKSGLHTLENNITEVAVEKVKGGLHVVEEKITRLQTKLKSEKPESEGSVSDQ